MTQSKGFAARTPTSSRAALFSGTGSGPFSRDAEQVLAHALPRGCVAKDQPARARRDRLPAAGDRHLPPRSSSYETVCDSGESSQAVIMNDSPGRTLSGPWRLCTAKSPARERSISR